MCHVKLKILPKDIYHFFMLKVEIPSQAMVTHAFKLSTQKAEEGGPL